MLLWVGMGLMNVYCVTVLSLQPVIGGVHLAGDHRQRAAGVRGAAADDGVQEGAQMWLSKFWCRGGDAGFLHWCSYVLKTAEVLAQVV